MVDQVKMAVNLASSDERPYQYSCGTFGYSWQFEVSTTFLCLVHYHERALLVFPWEETLLLVCAKLTVA